MSNKIIAYHEHALYRVNRHPQKKFKVPKTYERMPPERVVGCSTASATVGKELRTVFVSLSFKDANLDTTLETVNESVPFVPLAKHLMSIYGVHDTPSQTKQRDKRQRDNLPNAKPGSSYRDGRRQTVQPILLVFNDLEAALGRLFRNDPKFRKSVQLGDASKFITVGDCELEIAKLIPGGSGCSFEIYVRYNHQIIRIIGRSNKGYFPNDDVDANAEAFLPSDKIERVEMPDSLRNAVIWDTLTEQEVELTKRKTTIHTRYARDLHEQLYQHLTDINPKVICRNGTLPYSAASASGKIMFSMSEVDEFDRPDDRVTQASALSYAGGRHFLHVDPGYYENLWHYDAKSFYPWIMTLLPSPATCEYIDIEPGRFRIEDWIGQFGAMCISGRVIRGTPLRFHDIQNRRMGYIQGTFTHHWAPIPEIVLGVVSGELSVTQIHDGIHMMGSNENSFMRRYQLKMYDMKELSAPGSLPYELAKLLMNATSGKLAEINANHPYIDPTASKTRVPVDGHRHVYSFIEAYANSEDHNYHEKLFQAADAAFEQSKHQEDSISFKKMLDQTLPYGSTTGARYLPMHASQITGLGSALLNIADNTTGAIMCYTDSITTIGEASEGLAKYREIAQEAGYDVPETGMGSFQAKIKDGHGWIARDNQWTIRNIDKETGEVQQLDALHNFPNIDGSKAWDAIRKMVQTKSYHYHPVPRAAHLKEAYQQHIEPGTIISQNRTVTYNNSKNKPSPEEVRRSQRLLTEANDNLAKRRGLPTTETAEGCILILNNGINDNYLTDSEIAKRIEVSSKVIKNIKEGVASGKKQLAALQQLVTEFERENAEQLPPLDIEAARSEFKKLSELDPSLGTPEWDRLKELSNRLLDAG